MPKTYAHRKTQIRKRGRDEQLSIQELADAIGVNRAYVSVMRRCGFIMINRKASVNQAHDWLMKMGKNFRFHHYKHYPKLCEQNRPQEEAVIKKPSPKKKNKK